MQNLQSTDELLGALAGKVYPTEFAFSKWLANFEHAKVEGLGHGGLVEED